MKNNRTLYRSRNGIIFGVCRGIADYADISVIWIRIGAIGGLIFTGFWPIFLLYLVAAIFLRPAPIMEFTNDADWDFYQSYVANRKIALGRLRERCAALSRRTQRMEDIVTNKEYDWERRFHSGV